MSMRQPNRPRRPLTSFAMSVTILSLITCITSIVFLEPIVGAVYSSRYRSSLGQGVGISLLEAFVHLRYCIWFGLLLTPIVRWLYTQAKLSDLQARRILRVIAIVEFGYLLMNLCAAVAIGFLIWAWSN
jgi:hypothetical protein